MDLSDEYYEKCDDDSFDFSEGLSHVHRSSALPISQSLPRGSSHNGPRLGLMGLSEPPRDNKVGKQLDFKKMQESEDMLPIDSIVVSPPPEWVLCSICQEIFKKPTITRYARSSITTFAHTTQMWAYILLCLHCRSG